MLKIWAIFALALAVLPVQTHTQANKAKDASKSGHPSAPTPAIIPYHPRSQGVQPEAEKHVDADVWVIATPGKDIYDKAAFWATIALVVVGFAGIGVGICTLDSIRAQAREMQRQNKNVVRQSAILERQTAIQEAALAQWLDVEFERAVCGSPFDALGCLLGYAGVVLHFTALNNTPYPLTIKKVITGIRPPAEWDSFVVEETERLPPAKGGKAANYRFSVRLSLEGPTFQNYVSGHLVIAVKGIVSYEPVAGKDLQYQQFDMLIECSPRGAEKIPGGWPRQTEPQDEHSQQPPH